MTLIQLSNGDYEVAEACAGLRFLIATIVVSVLFAHLTYRKWHKIVIYLTASLVVPPIANGFRALGIVLLAHWSDNRIAHGADHIIYGWGFLVAILTVLMIIGMRYADPILNEKNDEAVLAPAPRRARLRAHGRVIAGGNLLRTGTALPGKSTSFACRYGGLFRPSEADWLADECGLGRLVAGIRRARRAAGLCNAPGRPRRGPCRCLRELLCRRQRKSHSHQFHQQTVGRECLASAVARDDPKPSWAGACCIWAKR